jgi:hypothetical protein
MEGECNMWEIIGTLAVGGLISIIAYVIGYATGYKNGSDKDFRLTLREEYDEELHGGI